MDALAIHRRATAFFGSPTGLLIVDDHGLILDVNRQLERVFGYSRTEIIGQAIEVLLATDQRHLHLRFLTEYFKDPQERQMGGMRTLHARRADGTIFPVHVGLQPIVEAGRTYALASVIDTTEIVAEQSRMALALSEADDLYENAPCGYYSLDPDGRFVRINSTLLSWLGVDRDEAIGKLGPGDFLGPHGRAVFREQFERFKVSGKVNGIVQEVTSRTGEKRWISVSNSAAYDPSGKFLISRGVAYDISALHMAEERLRQITLEQEAMLDNDMIGIVKLRERRAVWKNRALDRIFGYGENEILGQPSRILYIDDESHRALGNAAYEVLAKGGQYRAQLEMAKKDGTKIWIDMSGVMLSAETGESMWMLADITALKEHQAQIELMANRDGLTGLPNRQLLSDRMTQALALAQRHGHQTAVCYMDLDGFKQVNDNYGHAAGDRLLSDIAGRLTSLLRSNDTVARIGGDEFVFLLTHLEAEDAYTGVLSRVLEEVSRPVVIDGGRTAQVSASIGVAISPRHGSDAEKLVNYADAAMYKAKDLGRNRVHVYSPN